MTAQTLTAIAEAEALLFVIDARAGVTAGDEIIAQALRKSRQAGDPGRQQMRRPRSSRRREAYGLGFGEPLAISAEHNLGMEDIVAALEPLAPKASSPEDDDDEDEFSEDDEPEDIDGPLSRPAAAAGDRGAAQCRQVEPVQPAAGRGTLADGTGSRADARFHHRAVEAPAAARSLLHDTAGLRKKARAAGETLEEMSRRLHAGGHPLRRLRDRDDRRDAPFEKQDLTIADLIAREGRAIVFAVNKWDLLENKAGAISRMRQKLDSRCRRSPARR